MALFGKNPGMMGYAPRQRFPEDMDTIGAIPAPEGQMPAKRGLFGAGLTDKLGNIGAILRDDPEVFANMQQMQAQQQRAAAAAQAQQQQRQQDNELWYERKQWERDNPGAPEPTAIQRNYEWLRNQNPELADDYLKTQTQAPPMVVTNPDGTKTLYPAGSIPQAGASAAPPRPVGKLTPVGGAAPAGTRPFSAAPPMKLNGGAMTSGRRTVEGNRIVGGVANSKHLTGEAADYAGPNLQALLAEARKLPGLRRAFIHNKNHVHTEGDWNVPYFGKNGTRGR